MAAIDNLNAALTTEVAKISNTLVKAKAAYVQEVYIAALAKQSALEAREISSYSIGGRTFTYCDVSSGKASIQALERELSFLIYGRAKLIDFNIATTSDNITQ